MIRLLINELISEKQFKEGRCITLIEVYDTTGINRMTISKMINHKGYSTVSDNLDKLCNYFKCKIDALIQHIPESK